MDYVEEVSSEDLARMNYEEKTLPKDLARIVNKNVGIWFYKNEEFFLNNSLDLDYLIMEGCVEVLRVLENVHYTQLPIEELRKLAKTAVNRRMQKLFKKHGKIDGIVVHVTNYTVGTDGQMTDEEFLQTKSIDPSTINIDAMLFDDLKDLCTVEEYELIHKRFVEGKALNQIATESNLTEGRVSQKINGLLSKLKNKIGHELR